MKSKLLRFTFTVDNTDLRLIGRINPFIQLLRSFLEHTIFRSFCYGPSCLIPCTSINVEHFFDYYLVFIERVMFQGYTKITLPS